MNAPHEPLQPCMGGWGCTKRDSCPHHQAEDRATAEPSERLCPPGRDGEMLRKFAGDKRFAAWAAGAPKRIGQDGGDGDSIDLVLRLQDLSLPLGELLPEQEP